MKRPGTHEDSFQDAVDAPLSENIRMIIGGVVGLVAIVVPVLIINKLRKKIESGDTFKKIEEHLG